MDRFWKNFGQNYLKFNGLRVTELQSDRHPRVLSIWVGEIFLCLISLNSPTAIARRGKNMGLCSTLNPNIKYSLKNVADMAQERQCEAIRCHWTLGLHQQRQHFVAIHVDGSDSWPSFRSGLWGNSNHFISQLQHLRDLWPLQMSVVICFTAR